ncbi:LAFE_0G02828g1_1 [Lachancea fermentati]|uniref:LAFE_0G02828g1_1 n=1 Tax=Lachancea fermentati TaxID=4955 RepID=A0A1G4MGR1_LACFM|nr:LAFE_0G02828g1_1 [Lachancea fermentati]
MSAALSSVQIAEYYSKFFARTESEELLDEQSAHVNSRSTSRFKAPAPTSENEILSIEFNPNGSLLAYTRRDGTFNIWKLRTEKPDIYMPVSDTQGFEKCVSSISWNPNEENQIASVANFKTVEIWDAVSGAPLRTLITAETMKNSECKFDPTGRWLVVLTECDKLYLFDTSSGYSLKSIFELHEVYMEDKGATDAAVSIEWDSFGSFIFAGFKSGKIMILRVSEDHGIALTFEISDHLGAITCMKCDPTGRYFVAGSEDTTCSVWNVQDMCCEWVIDDFDDCITDVDICHNGYSLAVCSASGTRIYSLSNKNCLFERISKGVLSQSKFRFYPRKTWFISNGKSDVLSKFYVPKIFNPLMLYEREENKRKSEKRKPRESNYGRSRRDEEQPSRNRYYNKKSLRR